VEQQQVGGVTGAVQPRDALAAVGLDERNQLVRGHRDRHGPELRLLGEAQRGVDDATIGGDDQHALAFARGTFGLGFRRQRDEVERRIVRRDRQVPFELELYHLARLAGHGRQLDGLDGDRRAREADRHLPCGETPSVELRAQRGPWVLGVDGECFLPIALNRRDAEPVAEHDDREPERGKFHHGRVTPLAAKLQETCYLRRDNSRTSRKQSLHPYKTPQSLDALAQRREVEARTLIERRRFHGRVLATFGGSQFLPRDDTATRACAAIMIIDFTPVPIIR